MVTVMMMMIKSESNNFGSYQYTSEFINCFV